MTKESETRDRGTRKPGKAQTKEPSACHIQKKDGGRTFGSMQMNWFPAQNIWPPHLVHAQMIWLSRKKTSEPPQKMAPDAKGQNESRFFLFPLILFVPKNCLWGQNCQVGPKFWDCGGQISMGKISGLVAGLKLVPKKL